jgi:hypothetical protein
MVAAIVAFLQVHGAAVAALALIAACALAIPLRHWVSDPFSTMSREPSPDGASPWDAAHEAFLLDRWV